MAKYRKPISRMELWERWDLAESITKDTQFFMSDKEKAWMVSAMVNAMNYMDRE